MSQFRIRIVVVIVVIFPFAIRHRTIGGFGTDSLGSIAFRSPTPSTSPTATWAIFVVVLIICRSGFIARTQIALLNFGGLFARGLATSSSTSSLSSPRTIFLVLRITFCFIASVTCHTCEFIRVGIVW